jgi:hypothetical protein
MRHLLSQRRAMSLVAPRRRHCRAMRTRAIPKKSKETMSLRPRIELMTQKTRTYKAAPAIQDTARLAFILSQRRAMSCTRTHEQRQREEVRHSADDTCRGSQEQHESLVLAKARGDPYQEGDQRQLEPEHHEKRE